MASAAAIVLPAAYPWVLSVASGSVVLNVFQLFKVSAARKRAGIKYPALYADAKDAETRVEAKVFNCTQRAHQNTLEQAPYFLASLLITGLKHPRLATIFGAVWLAGRVFYTLGYATGDPAKRQRGGWGSFGLLGLLATTVFTSWQLLSASQFAF